MIKFELDEFNEFDPNAVQVLDECNNEVGYLSKVFATIYADKLRLGFTFKLKLKEKHPKYLEVESFVDEYTEMTDEILLEILKNDYENQ